MHVGKRMVLAALLLEVIAGVAWGQETEVIVQDGAVKAANVSGAAVQAGAGQKVVLAGGKAPVAIVNDPLVARVVEMDRLVQAERKAGKVRLESTMVNAVRIDGDRKWAVAVLLEMPNRGKGPGKDCRIANMMLSADLKFYAMDGKLLSHEVTTKRNENEGSPLVHFPEPVPPGGVFKFISVSTIQPDHQLISRMGDIWRVWQSNASRNCLNYYVFVLPPSAIVLETDRTPMMIGSDQGRIVVTIRNYTGPTAESGVEVKFLWPEKDGTSSASLLPLMAPQDERNARLSEEYDAQMEKIRTGAKYEDRSTPVRAALTMQGALLHKDKELILGSADPARLRERAKAEAIVDRLLGEAYPSIVKQITEDWGYLSTPAWPEKPADGTLHPIAVCKPGGLPIRSDTLVLIAKDGKWYWMGNQGNADEPNLKTFGKGQ